MGGKEKASSVQAGFANGNLADVLDWEDCSWTGHPSAGAIPAGLAVGELAKASGKAYIAAIVAGYEVYQRIAMAVQPSPDFYAKTGWGLTSWQIYAAAIPAAKLLKLDERRMRQAMGIAGVLTPIINRKIVLSRSDMYHYQHGLTCRDGVAAAPIAREGISGMEDVLDGDHGYWVSVSDSCGWEWMLRNLGTEYLIMETLIKCWPANMWIQQYLDIVDDILKRQKLTSDEIAEIRVSPSYQKVSSRMIYRPEGYQSIMDAQFSIPYCIACLFLDSTPGPNWFTEDRLKDPVLLNLAGKIKAIGPEMHPLKAFQMFREGEYPEAGVEIITTHGEHIKQFLPYPKGHPKNRLSRNEVVHRFRQFTSHILTSTRIDQIVDEVLQLEKLDDLSDLMALLRG